MYRHPPHGRDVNAVAGSGFFKAGPPVLNNHVRMTLADVLNAALLPLSPRPVSIPVLHPRIERYRLPAAQQARSISHQNQAGLHHGSRAPHFSSAEVDLNRPRGASMS